MDHYIDIRVLPDPEFSASQLMDALFAKLHRCLVDVGNGQVGISFPQQAKSLGSLLRLHGTSTALTTIMAHNWLKGLRDYTEVSAILVVPANASQRSLRRYQPANSVARLRRRSIKKGWLSEQEAQVAIPERKKEKVDLPSLTVKSNTNGHSFKLFIELSATMNQAVAGTFNHYGLSDSATIPWF